jgi:hypothetical protein
MNDKSVWVNVERDGRCPVVTMRLTGYTDLTEARQAIVDYLRDEGPDGESGEVTRVYKNRTGIEVETTLCGFGIDNGSIKEAIATGCTVNV